MSENLKTIKELADELGVSKQGIQYHIKSLPNKKRLKNDKGIIVLDSEEQEYIRQKSRQNSQDKLGKSGKDSQDKLGKSGKDSQDKYLIEIKFLEEKNSIKDNQIEYLKFQIENLMEAQKQTQNLLDQQQRLALQDKKLLEEYKVENDSLKALKMPSQDSKEEDAGKQSREEVERLRSENEALQEQLNKQATLEQKEVPRKWWKFWK